MDNSNLTATNDHVDPEDTTTTIELNPLQILNVLTAMCSAVANIIIILVVIEYRVLRSRFHLYLANWCICNLIGLLTVPFLSNIFGIEDKLLEVSYESTCLYGETFNGVLFGNFLFVSILLVDWYIANHSKEISRNRCESLHLYIIGFTWLIIGAITIGSNSLCILNLAYPISMLSYMTGYFIMSTIIVIILILRSIIIYILKSNVEKSRTELIIVVSFFLCWSFKEIQQYGLLSIPPEYEDLTKFLGYSHAWIMLTVLVLFDKSFRLILKKLFGFKDVVSESSSRHKEQSTVLI